MNEIREAASLCRELYKHKFNRGHVCSIFREEEQDALARRIALLRRDLSDAERLFEVDPRLPTAADEVTPGALER